MFNNRGQQKLIKSHVEYIKEETQINKINLKYALQSSKENLEKLDQLINLVYESGDIEKINTLAFDVLNVGYLYVRKNAYNSLVNSGDIRYIKSFEKKKSIINMYEYYTWTQSLDEGCRIAYDEGFFPYVKEHFDLVSASVQSEDVYYSKVFLNALSTYRFALDLRIKKFEDCAKQIEDFTEEINTF